jgi:two-component system chemotaxis response regulator CheY
MAPLKILLVDDSPTMRRILLNILKHLGYEDVAQAENGRDALSKLHTDQYTFVITDWNMPEMDGLTLVKLMREEEEFENIPVLMVTTRSEQEDVLEAMRAGVNNYIVKPFTPQVLKQKMIAILSQK